MEISPEPGSAESVPPVVAEDINIFGKYTVISTTREEPETSTTILRDSGKGYVIGIFLGEPVDATFSLTKISD